MNSPRFWVLLLAVVSFLGGTAAGLLWGEYLRPPTAPAQPFSEYQELLIEAYDLDAEVAVDLNTLMSNYQREIEDVKTRQALAMQDEIVRVGLKYRGLVRKLLRAARGEKEFEPFDLPST